MSNQNLNGLVAELIKHTQKTNHTYDPLFKNNLATFPIPFFGDPDRAEVITVGRNPAISEFEERSWPTTLSAEGLVERLKGYFNHPKIDPHWWFDQWEESLNILGSSYKRNAAHIDISPRGTISLDYRRDKTRRALLSEMLFSDVSWFFKFLTFFRKAKLMLVAGTATQKLYLNQFISERALSSGFKLDGSINMPRGKAKVAWHTLVGPGFHCPVFFCSVSPSASKELPEDPDLLTRIKENQDSLWKYLKQ